MKTALAFSGGKDSWACLLQADLENTTVLWVNTGKNYPEMLETISKARQMCPHFVELIVDRDGQNAHNGLPSDVVPINWTSLGQVYTGAKPVKVQSYLQCCIENIGANLQRYCKEFGFTHLIRGQRNDEGHKSAARNGDVVDGITYIQPIEDWTEQQVIEFVASKMELPGHFRFKHSSMDCYDCTAFARESRDRVAYTKEKHPALYAEYWSRKQALDGALSEAMKEYTNV